MRFTLNTLGAPAWSLEETARNARAYGYAGIDLRLLDGEVITLDAVRAQRRRLRALFPPAEVPSPAVGAVWDIFHTTRMGESPAEALRLVGERLVNVHLKDARRTDA